MKNKIFLDLLNIAIFSTKIAKFNESGNNWSRTFSIGKIRSQTYNFLMWRSKTNPLPLICDQNSSLQDTGRSFFSVTNKDFPSECSNWTQKRTNNTKILARFVLNMKVLMIFNAFEQFWVVICSMSGVSWGDN